MKGSRFVFPWVLEDKNGNVLQRTGSYIKGGYKNAQVFKRVEANVQKLFVSYPGSTVARSVTSVKSEWKPTSKVVKKVSR